MACSAAPSRLSHPLRNVDAVTEPFAAAVARTLALATPGLLRPYDIGVGQVCRCDYCCSSHALACPGDFDEVAS